MKREETFKILLKDKLFNKAKVKKIAGEIQRIYPSFKKNEFVRNVVAKFPHLELKARIAWIAECLKKFLPDDYKRAVGILVKALPAPNNPALSDVDKGFTLSCAQIVQRRNTSKAPMVTEDKHSPHCIHTNS